MVTLEHRSCTLNERRELPAALRCARGDCVMSEDIVWKIQREKGWWPVTADHTA